MAGASDGEDQCLKKLTEVIRWFPTQVILTFYFYITDRTETTSICQLDYADSEKVIPKLIKALHRKILHF